MVPGASERVSPGELARLLGVGLGNRLYRARVGLGEVGRLGLTSWWWRLHGALVGEWFPDDPHRVAAREGRWAGLSWEDAVYGEVSPGSALHLLEGLGVGPEDRVVDLGCGRGIFPLVAALALGARGLGVDLLPTFIGRGRRVAARLGLAGVGFELLDLRAGPLPEGTVFVFSGTCLQEESWLRSVQVLSQAPPGSRLLTVTRALPSPQWETIGRRNVPFSWGLAQVFAQRRR